MKKVLCRSLLSKSCLFLFMLILSAEGFAQWSADPTLNTAVVTDINQQNACQMTTDGKGGVIIAWWDNDLVSGDYNIYAQRISSGGQVRWAARGVAICTNPAFQHTPHMTSDGEGGAIIAWFDQRNVKNEIFVQKIDSSGNIKWTADGVSVGTVETHYQQGSPVVVSDGAGGVIIAFEDWRGDFYNAERGIRAQRISSSGSIMWGAGGVALNGTGGGEVPQIISDGNGGAIVAWDQYVGVYPNGNSDVYAQKVSANGAIAWADSGLVVCSDSHSQVFPQLTRDGNGGAIISWQDNRHGSYANLYAQKVNAAGMIQWDQNGIEVCATPSSQVNQVMMSDGNGGAFIAWQFGSNSAAMQRLNGSGSLLWAEGGVTVSGDARYPQFTSDGSTGVIITWYNGSGNVYAQRVDIDGNTLWYVNGIEVCTNSSNQSSPKITADSRGGAIICWDDYRNLPTTSTDIYVQRISENGILGEEATGIEKNGSGCPGLSLAQNYPNPFAGSTSIGFQVNVAAHVSLTVYDMLGHEVATLVNENMTPGSYTVRFEASGLPAGAYYYRLNNGTETLTRPMIIK